MSARPAGRPAFTPESGKRNSTTVLCDRAVQCYVLVLAAWFRHGLLARWSRASPTRLHPYAGTLCAGRLPGRYWATLQQAASEPIHELPSWRPANQPSWQRERGWSVSSRTASVTRFDSCSVCFSRVFPFHLGTGFRIVHVFCPGPVPGSRALNGLANAVPALAASAKAANGRGNLEESLSSMARAQIQS
jgi:hypothetical protein